MNIEAQPDEALRTVMSRVIADRWRAVWNQMPAVLAGKDPEAVHDMRVASRRLRAAMDVAVGCFPARWYRPLHRTAKRLTKALGDVRDLDVMLEALAAERDGATAEERRGIDHLIAGVSRERTRARKKMAAFLADIERCNVRKRTRRRFPAKGKEAKRRGHAS